MARSIPVKNYRKIKTVSSFGDGIAIKLESGEFLMPAESNKRTIEIVKENGINRLYLVEADK